MAANRLKRLPCLEAEHLNGRFLRAHRRFARLYARVATSPRLSLRIVGWVIEWAVESRPPPRGTIETTGGDHEREEDIQAAADKIGRHLFEAELHLVAEVPKGERDVGDRMLSCTAYREFVLAQVSDEYVRSFWRDQFGRWRSGYRKEAIAPVLNKVGQFL